MTSRSTAWRVIAAGMALSVLHTGAPVCQAGPLWRALFGQRNDSYYPRATYYIPAGGLAPAGTGSQQYYPVTAYMPVTVYYPGTMVPAQTQGSWLIPPTPPSYSSPQTTLYAPSSPETTAYGGASATSTTAPYSSSNTTTMYAPSYATPTVPSGMVSSDAASTSYAVTVPDTGYQTVYSSNMALQSTTCAPGCASCPTANAIPRAQTAYRTVWYRVPVTSFRATTILDPATQTPVTAYTPCTTYTWQARRVPVSPFRNFLSRMFGRQTAPTYSMPLTYAPAATAPAAACPPSTLGGTALPSSSSPNYIIPPSSSYPGTAPGSAPSSMPTYPGGTNTIREPADTRPSLDPNRYNPNPPASSAPSEGSTRATSPGSLRDPESATAQSSKNSTVIEPDHDAQFNLQPVPDPNALRESQKRSQPPRLLNPRDRRASNDVPAPGAIVLVSWPVDDPPAASADPGLETRPAPSPPPERRLDDSGWREVRR